MIYLSASSIRDFIACSKRFYYRKNFSEESVETQDASAGTIVHKLLELHWKNCDFESDFNKLTTEYDLDNDRQQKALKCLDNYKTSSIREKLKDNDLTEFYFKEKIQNGVVLVGKIDRIVVDDAIVIDWKTGITKKNISNDIQFIVYYTMYKKIFGSYPSALLQVNLAKGDISTFYPSKDYIDTLYDQIIPKMIGQIKSKRYYKEGYYNGSCYFCPFIGICSKDA